MWTKKNALLNKKSNTKKLFDYGFTEKNDTFTFSKSLGDLILTAVVANSHELAVKVTDNQTNDEYALPMLRTRRVNLWDLSNMSAKDFLMMW